MNKGKLGIPRESLNCLQGKKSSTYFILVKAKWKPVAMLEHCPSILVLY